MILCSTEIIVRADFTKDGVVSVALLSGLLELSAHRRCLSEAGHLQALVATRTRHALL